MTIHPLRNGTVTKTGWFLLLRFNPGYFFNPPPPGWMAQSDGVSVLTKAPDCVGKYIITLGLYFI